MPQISGLQGQWEASRVKKASPESTDVKCTLKAIMLAAAVYHMSEVRNCKF